MRFIVADYPRASQMECRWGCLKIRQAPARLVFAGRAFDPEGVAAISRGLIAATPLVLAILAEGESYGYAILKRVRELSVGELDWTDGMLYPVLHRMEANGWIKSHWVEIENGRKRKYYSLKKDGHQALKEKREQWSLISSVLRGLWKEQHV